MVAVFALPRQQSGYHRLRPLRGIAGEGEGVPQASYLLRREVQETERSACQWVVSSPSPSCQLELINQGGGFCHRRGFRTFISECPKVLRLRL